MALGDGHSIVVQHAKGEVSALNNAPELSGQMWEHQGYIDTANGSAATRTVQLVHIYVSYVLWLKAQDQATRKGAVSVPTLRRLWTVSDSFKLR